MMSLSVYHYLWMKRRRKRGDAGSDRDERKVWMLPPHPLNYISSKIVLGDSACHTQGPSKLPLLSVHFFHYTSMSSLIDPTLERHQRGRAAERSRTSEMECGRTLELDQHVQRLQTEVYHV